MNDELATCSVYMEIWNLLSHSPSHFHHSASSDSWININAKCANHLSALKNPMEKYSR